MKVIAVNGSPKKNGNTSIVLQTMSEELAKQDIETEIIHVGKELLHGCIACGFCFKSENNKCVFNNDLLNETAERMRQADGIILGSPVYFSGIAGTMKSFLDRLFYTSAPYFRNKVGAAFAIARRTGGSDTFHQLCNYLIYAGINMPSYQYWGAAYGRLPGEVSEDLEGMQTMRHAARDMAWLLKVKESGKDIPLPEKEQRIMTNFVR